MIVNRLPDTDRYTRIEIFPDGSYQARQIRHLVVCADFDFTEKGRQPPTASVHLLGTAHTLYYEDVQRLAHDYQVIADIAMKLEAGKRAAYAARFPATIDP